MTVDPLTFGLEIVNFLVLLWLLHRFLYRPIQKAIAQRKDALNQEMLTAQQREQEASRLKVQYEQRLADWAKEKTRQQEQLKEEIQKEREVSLAQVRREAEAERVRLHTLTELELAAQKRQAKALAAETALHLTKRLLERLASSELDQLIVRLVVEDLAQLSESEKAALRTAFSAHHEPVAVATARALPLEGQQLLKEGLEK